ncbi:MAG: C39 family peptidase [Bdellovibrionales bacterium]|nr:C39 family peptidase [Bdellovibrionales bacterium]
MGIRWRAWVGIVVAALLAAVSTLGAEAALPRLPLPLVRQANTWSCGAAALMSVLMYFVKFDGPETRLYPALGTNPDEGTHPLKIVEGARRYGLSAQLRQGLTLEDLEAALRRGSAVILDIQAWTETPEVAWEELWDDGHYVVLAGMDAGNVHVMDPSVAGGYAYIPRDELPRRWHDYEVVNGEKVVYRNMGIEIRGQSPAPAYPFPPIRVR